MTEITPPIITVDGPTGVGKGTVSRELAKRLGWHYLDSGVLYRVLGWLALKAESGTDDVLHLLAQFDDLDFVMTLDAGSGHLSVQCFGEAIDAQIRTEACSQMSSILSAIPQVRQALLQRQQSCAQLPGLVTDGRDMGTVVFPEASLKIYLDASLQERAERRYKQLKAKGIDVNLSEVLAEIKARDYRDSTRAVAPLMAARDAHVIDTTHLSINEVCEKVLGLLQH